MMRSVLVIVAIFCSYFSVLARGEAYAPTSRVGEFLRQFEKACRVGDMECIRSMIDRGGVIEEAKGPFFGFLGPKAGGEAISDLKVVSAPEKYVLRNSLLDLEIEAKIPVDFILMFTRTVAELETTIKVPVGYRDGKIWLVGVKRK